MVVQDWEEKLYKMVAADPKNRNYETLHAFFWFGWKHKSLENVFHISGVYARKRKSTKSFFCGQLKTISIERKVFFAFQKQKIFFEMLLNKPPQINSTPQTKNSQW